MTNKNYEQLKKEIIKAVPEIIELKFGCKVKLNGVYDRDEAILLRMHKDGGSCIFGMDKGINQERSDILFNRESIGRIIGRPITFADILIALQNQKYYNDIEIITFHKKQKINIEVFNINGKTTILTWNLNNNSLAWHWKNQKETCKSLFKILCIKIKNKYDETNN